MKHIKMFRAALATFVTVLLTSQLQAVDIFVSPTGNGEKTGANWSNALNGSNDGYHIDIPRAIANAIENGAAEVNVYFAGGNYSVTNQMSFTSIEVPIRLSGGYLAETDNVLDYGDEATIFTRSANYVRHIQASSVVDLFIKGIVFKNGYLTNTSAQRGGSLHLTSCNTMIKECEFSSNHAKSKSNTTTYGGAVYVNSGSLEVVRSEFSANKTSGSNCREYGGAICTINADLIVEDSVFTGNYCTSSQSPVFGGAIAANEGNIIIKSCEFSKNYVYCSQAKGSSFSIGGAISIRSANRFEMSDCKFEDNAGYYGKYPALKSGVYIDDTYITDGVMTSVVERCVFASRSLPTTYSTSKSNIILNGGCLFMTNCLIACASGTDSTMTNSISVLRTGSSSLKDLVHTSNYMPVETAIMELVNCTIADGKGAGAVRIGTDCDLILKNCIVSGNTVAGVVNATSIEHSYIQKNVDDGSWDYAGAGNLNPDKVGDINWTGAPYYHLLTKNANGAITNGWFSGTFESPKCAADSPCIDAGAPGSIGLNLEPYYSGRRVNIGAYGGTPWASKTSPLPGFKLIVR